MKSPDIFEKQQQQILSALDTVTGLGSPFGNIVKYKIGREYTIPYTGIVLNPDQDTTPPIDSLRKSFAQSTGRSYDTDVYIGMPPDITTSFINTLFQYSESDGWNVTHREPLEYLEFRRLLDSSGRLQPRPASDLFYQYIISPQLRTHEKTTIVPKTVITKMLSGAFQIDFCSCIPNEFPIDRYTKTRFWIVDKDSDDPSHGTYPQSGTDNEINMVRRNDRDPHNNQHPWMTLAWYFGIAGMRDFNQDPFGALVSIPASENNWHMVAGAPDNKMYYWDVSGHAEQQALKVAAQTDSRLLDRNNPPNLKRKWEVYTIVDPCNACKQACVEIGTVGQIISGIKNPDYSSDGLNRQRRLRHHSPQGHIQRIKVDGGYLEKEALLLFIKRGGFNTMFQEQMQQHLSSWSLRLD